MFIYTDSDFSSVDIQMHTQSFLFMQFFGLFVFFIFIYLFFWWHLPLKPLCQLCFLLSFFKIRSHELFAWDWL
jgi:hypothetical protein